MFIPRAWYPYILETASSKNLWGQPSKEEMSNTAVHIYMRVYDNTNATTNNVPILVYIQRCHTYYTTTTVSNRREKVNKGGNSTNYPVYFSLFLFAKKKCDLRVRTYMYHTWMTFADSHARPNASRCNLVCYLSSNLKSCIATGYNTSK